MVESVDTSATDQSSTMRRRQRLVIGIVGALLLSAAGWGIWQSPIFDDQHYRSTTTQISNKYVALTEELETYGALNDVAKQEEILLQILDEATQDAPLWRAMTPPDGYQGIHQNVQDGLDAVAASGGIDFDALSMLLPEITTYPQRMELVDDTEDFMDSVGVN